MENIKIRNLEEAVRFVEGPSLDQKKGTQHHSKISQISSENGWAPPVSGQEETVRRKGSGEEERLWTRNKEAFPKPGRTIKGVLNRGKRGRWHDNRDMYVGARYLQAKLQPLCNRIRISRFYLGSPLIILNFIPISMCISRILYQSIIEVLEAKKVGTIHRMSCLMEHSLSLFQWQKIIFSSVFSIKTINKTNRLPN